MISNSDIINKLYNLLLQELPGKEAQNKMVPDLRDIRISKSGKSTSGFKKSGVLILLYEKSEKIHICFIKRPEYEGPHSDQICFPGGKSEKGDTDLIQTAIRETYEEIGVLPENIRVLGTLSILEIPVSRIEVLPVIAYSELPPLFRINSKEVQYLIEISIDHLLDINNQKKMTLFIADKQIKAPYYAFRNEKIWGATAMMLSEFMEVYKKAI